MIVSTLHFKIGASALIPFSIEEQVFVARTDLAETFEEVLKIAEDVYNFSNQTEQVLQRCLLLNQEEGETESNDVEQSEQQSEEQSSDEDQPNTQGGASSSGAELEIRY